MSERESRGRCLLVSCFVGGVILSMFGLYRWPPQTVPQAVGGTFTRPARWEDRRVFIVDRSRFDVVLGLADYLASSALFALGIVCCYRGIPRRRRRRRGLRFAGDDALPVIFLPLSVFGGLTMLLISAGALASVFQA